jgi:hypothetical protein
MNGRPSTTVAVRWAALGLTLGLALATPAPTTRAARKDGAVWWVAGPMVKIRPHEPPPAGAPREIALYAARNEFEPFQIAIHAGERERGPIDVELRDLRGPSGAVLPASAMAVYREGFLDVKRPSSVEGETGEWPDPLLPRVDRYFGERRNAFPFRIAAGRTQPLWIELFVSPSTPAGIYSGTVSLTGLEPAPVEVPVRLTVWSFALPSTSSLPTAFGLAGISALKEARGSYTSDEELREITALYSRATLVHRLSTYGGTSAAPPHARRNGAIEVDWRPYDEEMAPLLDGTLLEDGEPLSGAKATSADIRTPASLDAEGKALYWQEWVRHFKQKGWLDRLYLYLWDEPVKERYAEVATLGRTARQADANIRNLVTVAYEPALADVVSIWTPIVNCIDEKPGGERFCPQPDTSDAVWEAEKKKGKTLWWYQSCGSHGCNIVGGRYFTGWPSYVVDTGAVAHRIMEWLTFKYRLSGELYYNTNEAFGRGVDPWTDLLLHGGNGDGTLFYPGKPEKIGGRRHIPIESLRLKLIREGLEDYEYFTLAAKRGKTAFVDERIGRVARRAYDWERDPSVLEAARREIGEMLNGK